MIFVYNNILIKNTYLLYIYFSAGIGRTGVLILMETALCLIETNQPVFPLDIVRQMREQHLGMIQTAVNKTIEFIERLNLKKIHYNTE